MILINKNNKIVFLFNLNYINQKRIIKNIKNRKVIKLNKYIINKIKIKKINKNIIIINNRKSKIKEIIKYLEISDKIIFYIIPNFNYIKNIYLIINKINIKYKIENNKIILILQKNNKKNAIYFLIIKNIFKKYKIMKLNDKKIKKILDN